MLKLNKIEPTTKNQELVFKTWKSGDNLVLNGSAGTGKTFVSLYLALEKIFSKSRIKKLVIIRSVVPTRDLGFLPGTVEEKLSAFETPYQQMCTELFNDKNSYETLKTKNQIEFLSTSLWKLNILFKKITIPLNKPSAFFLMFGCSEFSLKSNFVSNIYLISFKPVKSDELLILSPKPSII